jgi:uracil-DNA glycosylase family 4
MPKPRGRSLSCDLSCQRERRPTRCPLLKARVKTRGIPTFKYGANPDLFVVTESPDASEDEAGEPLVGESGKLLWHLFQKTGIKSAYLAKAVRCHPPDSREPDSEELVSCSHHTLSEIRELDPKAVLLLGRGPACHYLKARPNTALSRLRGWRDLPVDDSGNTVPALVTYHPNYLLKNPDALTTLQNDFLGLSRYLRGVKEITKVSYKRRHITTLSKLASAVDDTLGQPRIIGFDYETRGLQKVDSTLVTIAWGYRTKSGTFVVYSLALNHPQTPWSADEFQTVLRQLKRLFSAPTEIKAWLAHNSKFEHLQTMDLLGKGLDHPNFRISNAPVICSLQRAHAVDENRGKADKDGAYSLDKLARELCGITTQAWDKDTWQALYTSATDGYNFAFDHPIKKICKHNEIDVVVTLEVNKAITSIAKQEGFKLGRIGPLLNELPYFLASIERNGFPVNLTRLGALRADSGIIQERKNEILQDLQSRPSVQKAIEVIRGGKVKPLFAQDGNLRFPISKPEYRRVLFFDVLGLEPLNYGKKKTSRWPKGEPGVNKDFFSTYKGCEEAQLVDEWNKLFKLETAFLDSWNDYALSSHDCRIRSDYKGHGTNTGRLSNSNPNMQQIPSGRTKAAKKVKGVFMPFSTDDQLRLIVAADLSQAELRWLAQIASENKIGDIYRKRHELLQLYAKKPSKVLMDKISFDCDLHRATAAEIFNKPKKDIGSGERRDAKSTSFGIVYGQTKYGLSAGTGKSIEVAEDWLNAWHKRYNKATEWFHDTENHAAKYGWVETPMGRRRRLPILQIAGSNSRGSAVGHAKRVARNAPIQGVASDMNLWIAIKVQKYIDRYKKNWKLLGVVHDSLIADIPAEEAIDYIKVVRDIAHDENLLQEFGVKIEVPMEMEFEVGFSYGETFELTPSPLENEQLIYKLIKYWKRVGIDSVVEHGVSFCQEHGRVYRWGRDCPVCSRGK